MPAQRFVAVNGVRLQVTEAGQSGSPVVLLAHGFPELAYSWRHQIPVLAAAGYHVLAPDQRGYGGSSCPDAITDYDIHALTADLVGLLDDVGAARAVWIGHDWGAAVVWNAAQLHPDRVAAVAGLSVPPVPRPQVAPTEAFRRFGEDFYMLRFQEPGVADAELGADPAGDHARAVRPARPTAAEPLPDWISDDELDHYAAEFGRTGFTGGLNWYRNFDRNWATTEHVPARTIRVPCAVHRRPGGSDADLHPHRPCARGGHRPLPRGVASTAPATGCNRTADDVNDAFCWSSCNGLEPW